MIDVIELLTPEQTDKLPAERHSWMDNRPAYYTRKLSDLWAGDECGILKMWVVRLDNGKFELPIDPKPFTLKAVVEILVNREKELQAS